MSVRDETVPGDRWEFDSDVTDAFDDMLARSIPQYDVMRRTVFDVARRFVVPRTAVVDLGCSRGEALFPFVAAFGAQNRFVGVEVSEPMLAAARERFAPAESATSWIGGPLVDVRRGDLRTYYPPEEASVVLSVLTLQFVPIEYRTRVVGHAFESLVDGGALLLVEKVIGGGPRIDALLTDLYVEHKQRNGYTDEAIVRKAAALEGVLVPVTAEMNVGLLREAGFRAVECFWRWANFAGWVAVK